MAKQENTVAKLILFGIGLAFLIAMVGNLPDFIPPILQSVLRVAGIIVVIVAAMSLRFNNSGE